MTFNRFAGLGTLHALRTLVFRSRTAWLRRFPGLGGGVRDEKCLGLPRRRGPTVCRGRPPFGVSADGRFVAFASGAANLVAQDTKRYADVFVRHSLTGSVARVSVAG